MIDESTKSYTYSEIRESNINVKELEQYSLETNISGWKHLLGAYIFVKSEIKNEKRSQVDCVYMDFFLFFKTYLSNRYQILQLSDVR